MVSINTSSCGVSKLPKLQHVLNAACDYLYTEYMSDSLMLWAHINNSKILVGHQAMNPTSAALFSELIHFITLWFRLDVQLRQVLIRGCFLLSW